MALIFADLACLFLFFFSSIASILSGSAYLSEDESTSTGTVLTHVGFYELLYVWLDGRDGAKFMFIPWLLYYELFILYVRNYLNG